MIEAVIFDLDGTLTDTEKYYQVTWAEAIQHFGYQCQLWMPLELRSLGRPFAPERFKEWFGQDCDYYAIREYRKMLYKDLVAKEGINLKPNCVETLSFLKKHGILVALATANKYEKTQNILNEIGLFNYFDKIICADMVSQGKPAPDIYKYAVEQLGKPAHKCFAVEDSPNGVRSAFDAGCKVIMVPDLTEPDEELSKLLYARCDTLLDLCTLI